ncbi:adenine deaminase [Enterococcus asini]|uniref:adenine deaminase n=1 Tax=Enterococcus asini TaxID=57732 RepID=UPI001E55FD4C|nr:adenine deaminase [Enterococcus asini]MCD5029332.1 adenine deaminase [Enterococcus asini]
MFSELSARIQASAKQIPAELVIKNAKVVNVFTRKIMETDIAITQGIVVGLGQYEGQQVIDAKGQYVVPGLIDGHVHIESTLLPPHEFAKVSLLHGVTSAITDPHEIANVAGTTGLEYMISDAQATPMNIFTMLPSCVPVTPFETNGASLDAATLAPFMEKAEVLGLAEVMNYQAVANQEADILEKITAIQQAGGVIDGHAAGIAQGDLSVYPTAQIRTDHEAVNAEEAQARLDLGMYLMIREGTVAKDLHALLPVVTEQTARRCVFVTDDLLLDDLLTKGSIDHILRLAIQAGLDPLLAIQMATLNAAECFQLKTIGAIAPGYQADFFFTDDLTTLPIHEVFVKGQQVKKREQLVTELFPTATENPLLKALPNMNATPLSATSFDLKLNGTQAKIIEIIPNSLITKELIAPVTSNNGHFVPSTKDDFLKIAVVERHKQTGNIGLGIVRGFELKAGALATSVSHDSHNIVVVGTNDEDMLFAVERLLAIGGGMIAVKDQTELACLPLAIGGLMSTLGYQTTYEKLTNLTATARKLGASSAFDPFLTLSFLTLSVIPELKITDMGLFSFNEFALTTIDA